MADKLDPEQEVLFREVQEDLREEQLAKFWKSWGNWIIGGAVGIVVAVAGVQGWQSYDSGRRSAEAERLTAALQLAGERQTEAAQRSLAAMVDDSVGSYAMLASFQLARLQSREGNRAAAAATLRDLAADASHPDIYRDLATLLSVLNEMDDGDPASLTLRLAPLTQGTNPWRFSARELTAALALRSGDTATAKQIYEALAREAGTPRGVGGRAAEMRALLEH